MSPSFRSASEWFAEAERCYIQQHQGCAWCRGSHRVHQVHTIAKNTFLCQRCDFQVSFDQQSHRYTVIPGEDLSEVSDTMLGAAIYPGV